MPHACTNCGRTFPDGSKEMLSGCPDCGGNKFRYHPGSVPEDATGGEGGAGDAGGASRRSPPDPDDEGLPGRDRSVVDRATTTVRDWVSQRSDPPGGPTPEPDPETADSATPPSASPGSSSSPTSTPSSSSASTSTSPSASSESPSSGPSPSTDDTTGSDTPADTDSVNASMADSENTAQADARTGVVNPDEITEGAPEDGAGAPSPAEPTADPADGAGAPDLGTAERAGPNPAGDGEAGARARGRAADEPADPSATPSASNLAQLREELNEQFESIKIVEPGEYELNLMGLYDREEYIISLMEDGRYAIEVPETWRDSEDLPD